GNLLQLYVTIDDGKDFFHLLIKTLHTLNPNLFPYTTLFRSLYRANGDGAETTHRGHQLSMTSTVLIRCIRLLPESALSMSSKVRSEEHTSELQLRVHLICSDVLGTHMVGIE